MLSRFLKTTRKCPEMVYKNMFLPLFSSVCFLFPCLFFVLLLSTSQLHFILIHFIPFPSPTCKCMQPDKLIELYRFC